MSSSNPASPEYPFSDEYLDYLATDIEYDSDGHYVEFKGVKYCQKNFLCACKECREREKFKHWPFERSLALALYYIMSQRIYFNYQTDEEFLKFENGLLIDYTRDLENFEKYVEGICMMNKSFGELILNDFKSGRYRKRLLH